MELRGVFITGTDTGVGKTVVTAALTAILHVAGRDVLPVKPVQTGATRSGLRWIAPDLEFSLAAAGMAPCAEERAWMAPCCFEPPVSPHFAAEQAGTTIAVDSIVTAIEALARRHDLLVVEGAGGVLVPLNSTQTMLDLIARLGLPVILVSRPGLGTINHTLLSLRELGRSGVRVAGVVFNSTQAGESGPLVAGNRRTVEQFSGIPVVAVLPHWANVNTSEAPSPEFKERMGSALPCAGKILALLAQARIPAFPRRILWRGERDDKVSP